MGEPMPSKTIVFVHGNFVTYHCWDQWVSRYEAQGYRCITIPYPHRDNSVEALRRAHPDPEVGKVTIEAVIEKHVKVIEGLDEKPIIIGHSFGGLLTQILLHRGLAASAVAIDSVPPQGVIAPIWSFFRSTFPLLNPLTPPSRPYLMSFSHFQYTFVNGMPLAEQRQAYDEAVAPESIRLVRGGLGSKAHIDFKKPHAPLLMIGGENDHIMPAKLNKVNFNRYKASLPSVTEYKEFPGRNHYLIAAKGWTEVADYAVNWASKHS